MAIDTANKRFSLLGLANPGRLLMPEPDGSLDTAEDRRHMAYMYRVDLQTALGYLTAAGVQVPPLLDADGQAPALLDANGDIKPEN